MFSLKPRFFIQLSHCVLAFKTPQRTRASEQRSFLKFTFFSVLFFKFHLHLSSLIYVKYDWVSQGAGDSYLLAPLMSC